MHPDTIRDSVCETLNGGVRFGFIQKKNGRYYSAQIDDFDFFDSEVKEPEDQPTNISDSKSEVNPENGYDNWPQQGAMKRTSSRNIGSKRSRSRGKRPRSKGRNTRSGSANRRRRQKS